MRKLCFAGQELHSPSNARISFARRQTNIPIPKPIPYWSSFSPDPFLNQSGVLHSQTLALRQVVSSIPVYAVFVIKDVALLPNLQNPFRLAIRAVERVQKQKQNATMRYFIFEGLHYWTTM